MTLNNISFAQFIVGKLRQNLIDYNTNRSSQFGQWIYGDTPKITTLMKNSLNFPRISVETLNQPTIEDIGMGCTEQLQQISLKIVVWSVRDLICPINIISDESHTYNTGTDIYGFDSLPYSDITGITGTFGGIPYTFIKNTDYQIYDNDGDGMRDSVNWIADTPDDGTDFLVSYRRYATGYELCRFIAQNINIYIRDNWRNWDERKFWNYKLVSSIPIDFDDQIGVTRHEITIHFDGINIGDEI